MRTVVPSITLAVALLATAAAAAPPVASLSATRASSGRAPLLVYFDATASTDPDTSKPIHHLTYCFDAGDGNPAHYTLAGHKSVPKARFCGGPQFAYVYETPGTYTATVAATDAEGNQDTASISIDVTGWSAAETRCVSDNGSFAGCPVCSAANGTSCVIDADFDRAIGNALSAGRKRVLFRPSGTYQFDSTIGLGQGPILLGSFDASSPFQLDGAIPGDYSTIFDIRGDDVRIQNINYTGTSPDRLVSGRAAEASDSDHVLLHGMKLANLGSIVTASSSAQRGSARPQNWGFFELDASGGCGGFGSNGDNCVFSHIERISIVGSDLRFSGEHIVRLTHFARAFIAANRLSDPSNSTKTLLTLRGDDFSGDLCENGWSGLWTELAEVADNHFECSSNICTNFGRDNGCTVDNASDIWTRDNIFERNYYTIETGTDEDVIQLIQPAGTVNQDATFRDNVFNLQAGSRTHALISNGCRGCESYNNAVFGQGGVNFMKNWNMPGSMAANNVGWTTSGGVSTFEGSAPPQQSNNWDRDGSGGANSPADDDVEQLAQCPFVSCPPQQIGDFQTTSDLASVGLRIDELQSAPPDGVAQPTPQPLSAPFLRAESF